MKATEMKELNPNELKNVNGGVISPNNGRYDVLDDFTGDLYESFDTIEEAVRCARENHQTTRHEDQESVEHKRRTGFWLRGCEKPEEIWHY
ncbi:MAG: hypothetical protein J6U01_06725 [Clostridia bacterium]|nr:hypothetical protein [Clostridia bacterium]